MIFGGGELGEKGEILYSYDLEPLKWYLEDGSIFHPGPENLQIILDKYNCGREGIWDWSNVK